MNGLYDATTDVQMIRSWWESFPASNIGIRTGRESGVIVVDVDGADGKTALTKALGDLPETWHSTTGKGDHYYFRYRDSGVRNRAGFLPQVDIRGDGGYVVAPPSRHSNGTTYEWVVPPTEPLAELPQALFTLLKKPATERPSTLGEAIPEGQRNDTLYRRARSMKCAEWGVDAIEAALLAENEARCVPPLEEEEVRGIARRSLTQRDREDFQVSDPFESESFPLMSYDSILNDPLPPVDWLVKGLLAVQDRALVYGEFGSYKSWLLLDLALHLAAGKTWLGTFDVPRPRSVLYVDEEMNEWMLRRRVNQLVTGAGLKLSNLPFHALSCWGLTFKPGRADVLLNELHSRGVDPDVIIVETLRRVLVGSENEAENVAEFWRRIKPLQRAGKTFILSHHMRKPSNASNNVRYLASGSTDIIGGAETAFAITRDMKRKHVIEIACVKLRAGEEPSPYKVEVVADDKTATFRFLGWSKTKTAEADTQAVKALNVIQAFLLEGGNVSVRVKEIKAYVIPLGYPERTVERGLEIGTENGVLHKPQWGCYQVVDEVVSE